MMFQNIIYSINSFFYQFSLAELITNILSLITLIVALYALFTAMNLFRKHKRAVEVKRIVTILSSLDLIYYSLDKHVRAWRKAEGDGQSAEAQKFWRFTDLTELVTRLQELKILAKVHLEQKVYLEITALLEFLGDLILISYRGEDNSGKNYKKGSLITSDGFDERLNLIIRKASRGLALKNKKDPEKEAVAKLIETIYLS